jgi:hypothetical protein
MKLPKALKSKKLLLGVGLIGFILVGFFALKFMTSGGADAVPEKPKSARRPERKISKPQQKAESKKSPLFEAMEALKDPFRAEDPKAAELQDKLDMTQKEIEYLKATLEEKKLRKEIKDIEKALAESGETESLENESEVLSAPGKEEAQVDQDWILVKAILITDEDRSALLVSGNHKSWVHEGEFFCGWEVQTINQDNVILLKSGRRFVFFYDRPGITRGGES